MDEGWVNIVGGCCGTTPAHIRALAAAAEGKKPRRPAIHTKTLVSGIEFLEVDVDNRPVLVGERTNVLGSRKFKRLVAEGEFEAAAEIARAQVKNGAQVIDVCLQDPDRDEVADVNAFLERATKMVKAPLMLDSTDAKVLELGPEVEPGQVDPELDQSRGRRGAFPDGRAARAALRRRARRRHDRRGPRARHGRDARSASSRSRGAATRC